MRRFLVGEFSVVESVCDVTTLLDADEVFLTNSIQGIRSVVHFENKEYTSTQTQQIRKRCIELLNS
jgi:branched-subunit amino acid aminotransferase/4-amino-4-deoxychorismate lyase